MNSHTLNLKTDPLCFRFMGIGRASLLYNWQLIEPYDHQTNSLKQNSKNSWNPV